jgi:hypothetical protein
MKELHLGAQGSFREPSDAVREDAVKPSLSNLALSVGQHVGRASKNPDEVSQSCPETIALLSSLHVRRTPRP